MKMVLRQVLPALMAVMVTGCGGGVTYVASDPTTEHGPKPEKYDMPVSASIPARPHRTLGEMTVSMSIKPSFNETSTYDQAVERIRDEARKRGADAVVGLKTLDSQDDGASRGQLTLKGTLIQYTAPEPLVTTEPPR